MKVVSLFSGCGGLDLGFKEMGFDIIWANDILNDACKSYAQNIGDHIVCEDILRINPRDIPKADIVIGGPPCQGFSGVGKRDPDDKRSALVWDFVEILNEIKPDIFLFENVTGIKSAKYKNGQMVIDYLVYLFKTASYDVNVYTINAADYGVPQRRMRVFIVGNRLGLHISPPPVTHSKNDGSYNRWVSSFEAISDLDHPNDMGTVGYIKDPDNDFLRLVRNEIDHNTTLHIIPYASEKDRQIIGYVRPGGNYMDVPDEVATKRILNFKRAGGRTTTYGRLDPDMPAYTLNTYFDRPNVGCNIHYSEDRMITIREAMRLQSFPDRFELYSSSKRNYYMQVGNAVPPLLGLAWAKHLKKSFCLSLGLDQVDND
jgi:DNA (cytosine-5)-methyltransferase 1